MPKDAGTQTEETASPTASAPSLRDMLGSHLLRKGEASPKPREDKPQIQVEKLGDDTKDTHGATRTEYVHQGKPNQEEGRPDDEGRKKAAEALKARLFGRKPPKDEPDTKEEPEEEEEIKADDAEAEEDDAKSAAAEEEEETPPVSLSDITRIATEAATRAVSTPKDTLKQESKLSEIPEVIQGNRKAERTYSILQTMAKKWPSEYSSLPTQFLEELTSKKDYRTQWQKDNPGKRFDWKDDEHADFLDSIEVQYDPDDYDEAKLNVLKPSGSDESTRRLQELEAKLVKQEADKKAAMVIESAAKEFASGFKVSADLTTRAGRSAAKENGGILDRVAAEVAEEMDKHLRATVEIYSGSTRFNPSDQIHKTLAQIEKSLNDAFAASRKSQRGGKQFMRTDEFASLVNRNPAAADQYWTVGEQEMIAAIQEEAVALAGKLAKSRAQELVKLAKSQGLDINEEALLSPPAAKKGAESQQKPKKSPAPSTTSGSKIDSTPGATADNEKSWSVQLTDRLFQR